ncbi:MAG: TatD family hydrolase [Phycisphaerae bacterium]|jgi:TatD DNase family protein
MTLTDTHAHLTDNDLVVHIDDVIESAAAEGVAKIITIGTDLEDSRKALALAESKDNIYASVGFCVGNGRADLSADLPAMKELAKNNRIVAWGECGLDYHYDKRPRDEQKYVFEVQLEAAAELGLPVVVHTREAFEDTAVLLRRHAKTLQGILIHCFTGTPEQAAQFVSLGCHISFSGILTFKSAEYVREAAKIVPEDRLHIETDCPYLSPAPFRKQWPNEPALLTKTFEMLAQVRGIPYEPLEKVLTANAMAFFGI